MFGSLIIVLPSKFEGGQVHVSHGGEKDVFDISPSSEFTTSALAWYTDVTHEVKPVTSGYRLALAYNLLYTLPGLPPPHLQDTHSAVSNVEHVFRQWTTGAYNLSRSNPIVYLLDHEYSDVSLQFTALKGKDATLVSNIRPVAENQAISLRLGLLECSVHGDADEYARSPRMEVVHDTRYSIKGLYDLEGDLVSGNGITIRPESDMIPQDPGFDTQDPDDEDFEGYTGNVSTLPIILSRPSNLTLIQEGAPITYCESPPHPYRKLTITPRVSPIRFAHVPRQGRLQDVIADRWRRLCPQETREVEGRGVNREEQTDGSIPSQQRPFWQQIFSRAHPTWLPLARSRPRMG